MARGNSKIRNRRKENDRLGRSFFYFLSLVLIVGVAIGSYYFGKALFDQRPVEAPPGKEITIVVSPGDSVKDISKQLKLEGMIRNQHIFILQERLFGYHGKFQPGTYKMNSSWKPNLIMAVLAMDKNKVEQLGVDLSSVTVVDSVPIKE